MALTLEQKQNLTTNEVFKGRVKSAAIKGANDIIGDASQDGLVRRYCKKIQSNVHGSWLDNLMYQVVNNWAVTSEDVDDDVVQNAVNASFKVLAEAEN